jgi:osmotically inducible protein OsmC
MKRTATAQWNGTLKGGSGTLGTGSKTLHATPYSFRSRFADGKETNPEELIAAAHAGCFSMALSLGLEEAGHPPERIDTKAELTFDMQKLEITEIHLTLKAKVPGMDAAAFQKAAAAAKEGCPVSKALKAKITLDASLD